MKFFTFMALIAVVSAKPVKKATFEIEGFQTLDEQKEHQNEIQMANAEAHRNERKRLQRVSNLSNKGKLVGSQGEVNPFDGLIHEPNGVRKFPDGTVVDGSNDGVGY